MPALAVMALVAIPSLGWLGPPTLAEGFAAGAGRGNGVLLARVAARFARPAH